ncbi:DNA polymerase theta subunit [Blastomyces gilchristii SLH14081]|uniref:DNA polymerase theta subunit n=1 Tax=Blastomyces gilchristii (strain SLH14081) TaxID=559298 RepID=A0A179V3A9_BLAGS|nr:DNA polymerase theta subunit [Blastomyces gilchristii SLH14081]OAT13929.1 DNA polymerase theta subunit [Blastomyces gilchristii SLH14081]
MNSLPTTIHAHSDKPQTSIDIVRNQSFSTASIAGTKRSHPGDFLSPQIPTINQQPIRTFGNNTVIKPDGFIRPSLSSTANTTRIIASRIRDVPDAVGISNDTISEYSQRRAVSSTPGPSQNPLLSLSHQTYGLPPQLVTNFASLGVNCIYPWQASCLLGRGHLTAEKNLVYSAPTGGGKSLVADVLMLKRVIDDPSKKAILVLPYVALVQEKLKWLRRVVEGVTKNIDTPTTVDEASSVPHWRQPQSSIRVTGFFGGSKTRATWADTDIAVCTIEKANSLVNTAIEECKINDLGVVVLDELHMLDDEHRGYLIEIMVTKLMLLKQDIQIVGMSATLSNTEVLAKWLRANYYISKYRPIPIREHLVYNNEIYPATSSKEFFRTATQLNKPDPSQRNSLACRIIDRSTYKELATSTANAMVSLALETALSGYGALVFCGSRQACQSNAILISQAMPDETMLDKDLSERRMDLIAGLQSLPCGIDPVFQKTVIKGVAFHHAGLTTEERDLIAEAYDKGILRVLVATCSLAAGINLPARRVILCGARMGRDLVGPAMLRQMRGRAGRKGKDEVGETYLLCQKDDLEAVAELLEAEMPAIASGLTPEKRGIKRALLEAIATRLVSSRETVNEYVTCTLLYQNMETDELFSMVDSTLKELVDHGLVDLKQDEYFEPTQLGQAVVSSSLSPEDGIFIHDELKRALKSFVMDGEMHIFYMFAPLQNSAPADIDWSIFRDQMNNLDESGIRALQLVGVEPAFVNKMAQSRTRIKDETLARIYHRAYTAFQLRDLSNEVPISTIARKYNIPRGNVQTLTQICHGFAAGIVKFCQRMGWDMLAVVLDHMRDRLQAGARADLLEMAQVAYVKSRTARLLWENGFKTLRALAEADPKDLLPVLMMAQPRNIDLQGSQRISAKLLTKAEIIVGSANKIWESQLQLELEE